MKQGPFSVHCIGVGGAGMSGVAKVLAQMGWRVSGSDLVASERTQALARAGVTVYIGHGEENVNGAELVVVSSAIPPDNCELRFARQHGIPVISRAEMLNRLMVSRYGIAIAGTHGKTTTTSMISLVLERLGWDPTVVVGGEVFDIGSNAKLGTGPHMVVEADESDASFLCLSPRIVVVTNVEADHLDHYSGLDNIRAAFLAFMRRVPRDGLVVTCADDSILSQLVGQLKCRHVDYGLGRTGRWQARSLQFSPFRSRCVVYRGQKKMGRLQLRVPGRHNIANALAALAVGEELGLPFEAVAGVLQDFSGVARRFEVVGEAGGVLVIDDYAHHPTEIRVTLAAARHLGRRRVVVFQPHRYTRTSRLRSEFGNCFTEAEEMIITDVYPAGEQPIPGVSGQMLVDEIRTTGRDHVTYIPCKNDIPAFLRRRVKPGDVVLTLGAGDIRTVALEFLKQNKEQVSSNAQTAN